jgi:hypothetical protein
MSTRPTLDLVQVGQKATLHGERVSGRNYPCRDHALYAYGSTTTDNVVTVRYQPRCRQQRFELEARDDGDGDDHRDQSQPTCCSCRTRRCASSLRRPEQAPRLPRKAVAASFPS